MRWSLFLGFFALGVVAAVFAARGGSARSTDGTLSAAVGPGFSISLTQGGSAVTTLAPGTYTVNVSDMSTLHNFHLSGPGVNQSTDVDTTSSPTWTVTLSAGSYHYQCDAHPTMLHGDFTVGSSGGTTTAPTTKLVDDNDHRHVDGDDDEPRNNNNDAGHHDHGRHDDRADDHDDGCGHSGPKADGTRLEAPGHTVAHLGDGEAEPPGTGVCGSPRPAQQAGRPCRDSGPLDREAHAAPRSPAEPRPLRGSFTHHRGRSHARHHARRAHRLSPRS